MFSVNKGVGEKDGDYAVMVVCRERVRKTVEGRGGGEPEAS